VTNLRKVVQTGKALKARVILYQELCTHQCEVGEAFKVPKRPVIEKPNVTFDHREIVETI
jgi:hypothetical protein